MNPKKPFELVHISEWSYSQRYHYVGKSLCDSHEWGVLDLRDAGAFLVQDDFTLAWPIDEDLAQYGPGEYSIPRGVDRTDAKEYARLVKMEMSS